MSLSIHCATGLCDTVLAFPTTTHTNPVGMGLSIAGLALFGLFVLFARSVKNEDTDQVSSRSRFVWRNQDHNTRTR